jgi:hypothetical protein
MIFYQKYLWLILLFSNLTILAQKSNPTVYYQFTNKAETEICKNNYKEALKLYSQSFNFLEGPFTHDVYNAFVCSWLLGKPNHDYYKILRERGVSKKFLIEVKKINVKTIDSLERLTVIVPKINKGYRDTLNVMVNRDQSFRKYDDRYTTYADTIKKIDNKNAIALVNLINSNGFPSEKIIGNDSNDLAHPIFFILIFHNAHGAKFQSVNFSSMIDKAIKDGKIDNRLGAQLIDYSDGTDQYGTANAGLCYYYWEANLNKDSLANWALTSESHKWYLMPLDSRTQIKYDKNREKYHLDNIDDYRKKMQFQLKNNLFDFGLYGYKQTGGIAIKSEFDYMFKNLIEIK